MQANPHAYSAAVLAAHGVPLDDDWQAKRSEPLTLHISSHDLFGDQLFCLTLTLHATSSTHNNYFSPANPRAPPSV